MNRALKKVISLICAVACGSAVLSGCGEKKNEADGVTLTLWMKPTKDADERAVMSFNRTEEMLKAKFPDITFNFELQKNGTDYRQEYDKVLMANTAPAIFAQFSYTDIPARIKNGTIADITSFVDNWDMKKDGKVIDVFDKAINENDKWYAIPRFAYTKATLCNTGLLAKLGEDINNLPETWDEFAAMGERVTDLSVPGFGYSLIGMNWCAWPFTAWIWSAGGEMVRKNDDGTYRIAFNEEPGVDTAMFMNEMIWKHKMTQKDILLDYGDLKMNTLNGTSCTAFLGLTDLNQSEMDEYGIKTSDFVEMAMPVKDSSIERPVLAGGEVITFNPKLSKDELKAAWEVAEYLYFSDEMMQKECDEIAEFEQNNVNMPGRSDWYQKKLEANKNLTEAQIKSLVDMQKNTKLEPYCSHWSDVKTQLVAPLQKIYLTQGITREETKRLLDECAEKLYSLYPETFRK